MGRVKAIIFDFIGTLAEVKNYSLEASKVKLYQALTEVNFNISLDSFLKAYGEAHEKYREVRYEQLSEVTNAVWISEALNNLGFKTTPRDVNIQKAVSIFFEDYLDSLNPKQCAVQLLQTAKTEHRLGLISNFTYAPVIRSALKKLCMGQFFDAVMISEEVGWRKPSVKIFERALNLLDANAGETVYVGDSPLEDVKGARDLGMKTIFVPSQFYSVDDLRISQQKPNFIVDDICVLQENFHAIIRELTQ